MDVGELGRRSRRHKWAVGGTPGGYTDRSQAPQVSLRRSRMAGWKKAKGVLHTVSCAGRIEPTRPDRLAPASAPSLEAEPDMLRLHALGAIAGHMYERRPDFQAFSVRTAPLRAAPALAITEAFQTPVSRDMLVVTCAPGQDRPPVVLQADGKERHLVLARRAPLRVRRPLCVCVCMLRACCVYAVFPPCVCRVLVLCVVRLLSSVCQSCACHVSVMCLSCVCYVCCVPVLSVVARHDVYLHI